MIRAYHENLSSSDQNAQRLFMEVILPKFLAENKEASKMLLEKCAPYENDELTFLAIVILKTQKIEFENCSIPKTTLCRLLSSISIGKVF